MAGRRGLGSAAADVLVGVDLGQADRLKPGRAGQRQHAGEKGGEGTGANPTDCERPGTKRHLLTDRNGTPLAVRLTGANRHDSIMVETMRDAAPRLQDPRGRPRRRPAKLHANKAYDHRRCRRECRERSAIPRIARRCAEDSKRLGRHRWVVKCTHA